MKRSRFSEEQIIGILKEQEAGMPTVEVCEGEAVTSSHEGAASAIWRLREDLSVRPADFCWVRNWLLVQISNSRLRDGIEKTLVAWIFAGYRRSRSQCSL